MSNRQSPPRKKKDDYSPRMSTMSILVSYPVLIQHEERLQPSPYDVSGWMSYLDTIDELLEALQGHTDRLAEISPTKRRNKESEVLTVGGFRIKQDLQGLEKHAKQLRQARNGLCERALSLLPGSYKLWHDYLQFRVQQMQPPTNASTNTPYATRCSSKARRFHATLSAFERSLVRMHKMPRIWRLYLDFIIHHGACFALHKKHHQTQALEEQEDRSATRASASLVSSSVFTKIRRMFDRALCSLPATQHDKIWPCYLYWVQTGASLLQSTTRFGEASSAHTAAESKLLHSFLASVDHNYHTHQQQDHEDHTNTNTLELVKVPPLETTLRAMRRYARYYNPAGREDLARVCIEEGEGKLVCRRRQHRLDRLERIRLRRQEQLEEGKQVDEDEVGQDGDESDLEDEEDEEDEEDTNPNNPSNSNSTSTSAARYGEGAALLRQLLNDPHFLSPHGTTKYQLWMTFVKVCTRHPLATYGYTGAGRGRLGNEDHNGEEQEEGGIDFDGIIRAALSPPPPPVSTQPFNTTSTETDGNATPVTQTLQFGEMEGTLWIKLAEYYIRSGQFPLARSIYEEGMNHVRTVRDFVMVFDRYAAFEEGVLQSRVRESELLAEEQVGVEEGEEEKDVVMKDPAKDPTKDHEKEEEDEEDEEDFRILLSETTSSTTNTPTTTTTSNTKNLSEAAIELDLARAEYLMERRPLLLNRVLLRQNPHNVGEWLHRAELWRQFHAPKPEQDDYEEEEQKGMISREEYEKEQVQLGLQQAMETLQEATYKVKPYHRAVNGNPTEVWLAWAKLAEEVSYEEAHRVFVTACLKEPFRSKSGSGNVVAPPRFRDVDEEAQLWCAFVELELRHERYEGALEVVRRGVATPSDVAANINTNTIGNTSFKKNKGSGRNVKGATPLYKSLRLWNLALDLEESLGGTANAKAAYARCLELAVATPTIVLNYATFLKEQSYFEESYSAYERGLALFALPHEGGYAIWKVYLKEFVQRFGGKKMERTRDLFERCLQGCCQHPPSASTGGGGRNQEEKQEKLEQECIGFYLQYAKWEEAHGLAKRALAVYERLCTSPAVSSSKHKAQAYQLYLTKAESYLGASQTRPIYEAAIAALEDEEAAEMCLQYAALETKLGEVERARAALTYGAQMADPRIRLKYWSTWHDFEVKHGDEDSFREMLRVKRGVAAAFSTTNYNAAEMGGAEEAAKPKNLTEEEALEMIARNEGVKAKTLPTIGGFVRGKRNAKEADLEVLERQAARLREATTAGGGDGDADGKDGGDDGEIDLDDEEEEEEQVSMQLQQQPAGEEVHDVTTKSIPQGVFGGLKEGPDETKQINDENMGALARLRSAAAANK